MKKVIAWMFLLGCTGLAQNAGNPVMTALRQSLERQAKTMPAALETMPEDKYSYRPTAQQMSFAHLAMHIAESNNLFCSRLSGQPEPKNSVTENDNKGKLVAAAKESFDFCAKALASVQDASLGDEVALFGGRKGTKASAALMLAGSWADHYGAAAIYLRLNGLLPPTAKKP